MSLADGCSVVAERTFHPVLPFCVALCVFVVRDTISWSSPSRLSVLIDVGTRYFSPCEIGFGSSRKTEEHKPTEQKKNDFFF